MLDERWSTEAEEIGDALRRLLANECTMAHVRRAEESSDGRDAALEKQLEDFGVWEPQSDPGVLARIAYELGRALAPLPFAEALPAMVVLGEKGVSYGLEGDVPAALDRVAIVTPRGLEIQALNGAARRTTAGDFLVRHADRGVGEAHGDGNVGMRMRRLVRLADSARLIGAARALLEIGVKYAKERVQGGRPIGAFQGVAHRLADVSIAVEGAELLLRKAAFTGLPETGGDIAPSRIFAIMLRAKAVAASRLAATSVHQVMAGYGFTVDFDCQLYSRRIRSWTLRLDRPEKDLAELARTLLDPKRRDGVRHLWSNEQGLPLPKWAAEADARGG